MFQIFPLIGCDAGKKAEQNKYPLTRPKRIKILAPEGYLERYLANDDKDTSNPVADKLAATKKSGPVDELKSGSKINQSQLDDSPRIPSPSHLTRSMGTLFPASPMVHSKVCADLFVNVSVYFCVEVNVFVDVSTRGFIDINVKCK